MVTYTPGFMRIPLLESHFKDSAPAEQFVRRVTRKTDGSVAATGLSDRDKVVIRDTWNKFQAHQAPGLEAFVGCVYKESPAIYSRMGVLGDEVEDIIFGLFDLCIRSLLPHSEVLGREAAIPAHADPTIQWKTVDDYARWFAEIGSKEEDWEVFGRAWIWALQEIFILEDLELHELRKGKGSCFYRFYQEYIQAPMVAAIREHNERPNVRVGVDLLDRHDQRILHKARAWLEEMAKELRWSPERLESRFEEISEEMEITGTYTHTFEELEYGARVAWRNAAKCIGRVHWNNLIVRDCRDITDPDEMYQEVLEHLKLATCGGNVQIVMTVFRAKEPHEQWGPRFWNTQFVRYAAYRRPDGTIMGDADNLEYTDKVLEMGWQPPNPQGEFDLLPIVIDMPDQPPRMYELPPELVAEVDIKHPTLPQLASLGLKWCAIPAICNIGLDLGGLRYTCAPFNGWFMGTEIARDLLDIHRYNKTDAIAEALGLDTSNEQSLWRDRVHLELNYAILHSFQEQRITLVDHHTASRQFLVHDRREKQAGRECPARWSWIVPPMSGSACPVFHHEMREFILEPKYRDMFNRWEVLDADTTLADVDNSEAMADLRVFILFGSESGTAENFAYQAARRFKYFQPEVMALNECTHVELENADLLLVITSTFGEGELPHNARQFAAWLEECPADFLQDLPFGVFGIGSSIYENFCAAGIYLNQLLEAKGAVRLLPLHKGDELNGQARRLHTWLERIARVFGLDQNLDQAEAIPLRVNFLERPPTTRPVRLHDEVRTRLLENQELLQGEREGFRSTRFFAVDASDPRLAYEPGDHIGVFPVNPSHVAQTICERVGVPPHAWFTIEGSKVPFALPNTPYKVLREDLDLSLHGSCEELLLAMKQAASCPQEQERLDVLLQQCSDTSERPDTPTFSLAQQYSNLADLLVAYPSVKLTFAQLLSLLPRQKARFYSIASSPLRHPKRIHFTVSVAQVPMADGNTRPGLCSHYLAGLPVGQQVRMFHSASAFRLPADLSAPVLMVGPGTGVSPLLGFLEHRQALWEASGATTPQEAGLGPAWLFFGCRNQHDFLFREQLERWQQTGILARLNVAFSRKSGQIKTYVQHMMEQNKAELWAYLSDPRCHYYVCGDARMADDVFTTLHTIATTQGALSPHDADAFFAHMKQAGRFSTDVWSDPRQPQRAPLDAVR